MGKHLIALRTEEHFKGRELESSQSWGGGGERGNACLPQTPLTTARRIQSGQGRHRLRCRRRAPCGRVSAEALAVGSQGHFSEYNFSWQDEARGACCVGKLFC